MLSLWDAVEGDSAGENREVVPKFINLNDASIKIVMNIEPSGRRFTTVRQAVPPSFPGGGNSVHHRVAMWVAPSSLPLFSLSPPVGA